MAIVSWTFLGVLNVLCWFYLLFVPSVCLHLFPIQQFLGILSTLHPCLYSMCYFTYIVQFTQKYVSPHIKTSWKHFFICKKLLFAQIISLLTLKWYISLPFGHFLTTMHPLRHIWERNFLNKIMGMYPYSWVKKGKYFLFFIRHFRLSRMFFPKALQSPFGLYWYNGGKAIC